MIETLIRTEKLPHEFCTGCAVGEVYHYAARAVMELNLNPDEVVFVSGIGCCARGASYVRTDSATTLHGRAMAFASGMKLAKPELKIIVVTGDGDGAGIGGNHLIHAARRNLDLTVVLLNNGVFGATGGQYSPTTPLGVATSTSPYGNLEEPFDLCNLVSAAGASYVARWTTFHFRRAIESIKAGIRNPGFAFIEIVGQCPTYYGRKVLNLTPSDHLVWFRKNSVDRVTAEKLTSKELTGKIVVGEFKKAERAELTEKYRGLHGQPAGVTDSAA